mmetsp:Transcript_16964/g.35435  ORF Transcript_16964/g.35435 Transcript_16964/m.35435 type:complete len:107 (-) Transcript_16964:75-395(-)
MAGRSALLPLALIVLVASALLYVSGPAFVGGSGLAPRSSLRTATAQRVLPPGVEGIAESSVSTALAVAAWGMAANIAFVFVPVTFFVILYLQSERTKAEDGMSGLY